MNKTPLALLAVFLSASALAETAPVIPVHCRFSDCRADLQLAGSFKLKCDGESERNFTPKTTTAGAGPSEKLRITLISAENTGTGQGEYPSIYIDGNIFATGVGRIESDLRLSRTGRVQHGFCEREEAQE